MLRFDKIKIISQIDFISDINEKIFISNMKDNVLLYYKYKQKSPFVLIIIVNYEKKELVLEFTGKILLESYKELIHRDNLRQCLDSINKMGICTLDVDSIITHGIVAKCDVTKDVKVDNFPMIVRYCRQQLKNYRKWICKNYENGVIIENIVKTLRYKKRLILYDKYIELHRRENECFLAAISNRGVLLDSYKGVVRFELNINTMAQIRALLSVADNSLNAVFASEANPILSVIDEAVRESPSIRHCTSLRDYERVLLLKECHNDLVEVEAKIRTLVSNNTSMKRVMKPYIELYQQMQNTADLGVDIRKMVA
ncbi:hypothetical protein [Bacteroides thetaiotaomicron]|jgi:hypothetical protein|uniref:hypothetical protein n=1 Tax=Bacteroides thetaiotaomicron TaxID=818 RepID=UPI000907FBDE|nr:hypothetical protein [Bacteroides thetaiotaomicron]MCS2997237.1 hypothetical protein [Bacteroides thetaiotaomicron]